MVWRIPEESRGSVHFGQFVVPVMFECCQDRVWVNVLIMNEGNVVRKFKETNLQ